MASKNSNFRLSKQTKRFLAQILDPHERGAAKRAFIDAELVETWTPKRKNQPNGSAKS